MRSIPKKSKKIMIHVDAKYRIQWLNFASSYIHAADVISKEIKKASKTPQEEWRSAVMVIPLLFLLRHSIELSIKSIFISWGEPFEKEHNLQRLLVEAEQLIGTKLQFSVKQTRDWSDVKETVVEFTNTTYFGNVRFFKVDDDMSLLRYLQVDKKGVEGYKRLKNIDHEMLVQKAKKLRGICEILTLQFTDV